MTFIFNREIKEGNMRTNIGLNHHLPTPSVWRCARCRNYHIAAGQHLPTLDCAEFAIFAENVLNSYAETFTLADTLGKTLAFNLPPLANGIEH
jgi:hypothetical protein